MLADYKLYWDPKSNLLFIPTFETTGARGVHPRRFDIEKFRPCDFLAERGILYPSFKAVLLANFGTWGLVGYAHSEILKDFTRLNGPGFVDKGVRANFQKFVEDHPNFKNTRFATKEECIDSIPKEAICVPEA